MAQIDPKVKHASLDYLKLFVYKGIPILAQKALFWDVAISA